MTKGSSRRFTLRAHTKNWLGAVLLFVGFLTLMAAVLYFVVTVVFDGTPSAVVITSEDVGRLQSARFIDQFVQRETVIDTEKGSFLVRGVFPAVKDHALVLERREGGAQVLCDPAEKVCAPLAR
ncbi:MAG: hypothetical protein ACYC9J_13925 [Sulfuricaulis sp.]